MLKKFTVSDFKCFRKDFQFDLSTAKNYTFNPGCVKNGIVNNAIVYGYNGIGKSNLGWAVFDIIKHLTDKSRVEVPYRNYINAYSDSMTAVFDYEFLLGGDTVRYKYSKTDHRTLVAEQFWVNGNELISIDRSKGDNSFSCRLTGTESLNKIVNDSSISVLKYVKNNSVLDNSRESMAFRSFFAFVEHMLFFRSLEDRTYIGQEAKGGTLVQDIIPGIWKAIET